MSCTCDDWRRVRAPELFIEYKLQLQIGDLQWCAPRMPGPQPSVDPSPMHVTCAAADIPSCTSPRIACLPFDSAGAPSGGSVSLRRFVRSWATSWQRHASRCRASSSSGTRSTLRSSGCARPPSHSG